MHHTLLPIPERKALRTEYRIRVLVVLCFMLSLAGLIGIAALFPAFVRASSEEHSQFDTVASLQKDKKDSGVSQIEAELSADSALLKGLATAPQGARLSSVIEGLVGSRGTLQFTSLAVSRAAGGFSVVIQGLAPTRDALLAFKSRLEAMAPGNKVTLPISELAKSADIQFSIQLTESLP